MPAKRKRTPPTLPNPSNFAGDQMVAEPETTAMVAPAQQTVVVLPRVPWWAWVGLGIAIGYGAPRALGKVRTMVGG